MTAGQYINKVQDRLHELLVDNKPAYMGFNTALGMMVERIFERGEDASGSPIGKYSKKPIYVNPENSPQGFVPMGKYGDTGKVGNKTRKTKYFEEGYKGFRAHIGRQSNFVNLRLSGDLQSDLSNSTTPLDEPSVTKISNTLWTADVDISNVVKIDGAEEHFETKIFIHSKEELAKMKKIIEFETAKILRGE